MRLSIVTPVFNGSRYIDEAILSVVGQAGPFTIRYHIQDGGSTDGTLDKLAQWQERIGRTFPMLCENIEFSYASQPDGGMYDAIKSGFAACGAADAMSWINADDRYEPGAFVAVTQIFQLFGDVEWICGRGSGIDATGAMTDATPVFVFPRAAIAAGIFDGRHAGRFVQQAGTFWRSRLWRTVGGVDTRFRVAGDFDLWRRFANHTDLVSVDAFFGCHRTREGQLSTDIASYYAEIDASFSNTELAARAAMAARYRKAFWAERSADDGLRYRILRSSPCGWVCEHGQIPLLSPEIDAVYRSTSWRITAPLRMLVNGPKRH